MRSAGYRDLRPAHLTYRRGQRYCVAIKGRESSQLEKAREDAKSATYSIDLLRALL
jgi:hypothetical protein